MAKHSGLKPFQPGQSGNPAGRPKGARSKLGEAFLEALHEDFSEHGAVAIVKTREADPAAYMRVIASLLPKEVKVESGGLSELSDDELTRILDIARATLGTGDQPRSGAAKKGGSPLTH